MTDGGHGSGVVDAHHHVWWLDRTPWLQGPLRPRIFGDYGPLRRDYLAADFAADAGPHGVTASVHVQVNLAPEDAAWEVAAASAAGRDVGLVQRVVGQADLRSPSIGDDLDALLAAGPVVGVRQQLHWHERPEYRFAASPDVMADPRWQRGLVSLGRRGLLFEVQVFPEQMPAMVEVAAAHPGVMFVLLHAGMLVDRSPAGVAAWRNGLEAFARLDNTALKLSGLGTFVRRCTVADWAPVVEVAVDTFGLSRCLFGSNFPIESLWTTYGELMAVMRECLMPYTSAERAEVWRGTAERLYRVAG